MRLKERVYSVLIVSNTVNFNAALKELLPVSQYKPVSIANSCSEAKRLMSEREFDFVIVNAPLPDESGIRFAIDCCRNSNTVVLILAKSDIYDEIYERATEHGVFTLAKPTSKTMVSQALSWMAGARERLRQMEKKTSSVEERMEAIRVINRAKFVLISELKMTEEEAHHYIEKNAMDNCVPKKQAAEAIIKRYS